MVLDFFAEGRHLFFDAVVTTSLYRSSVFSRTASIPEYVAKQAEDRKFHADYVSAQPISIIHGGPHVLVPFVVEDGARLGAHALALLRALALVVLEKRWRTLQSLTPICPHTCILVGPAVATTTVFLAPSSNLQACHPATLP